MVLITNRFGDVKRGKQYNSAYQRRGKKQIRRLITPKKNKQPKSLKKYQKMFRKACQVWNSLTVEERQFIGQLASNKQFADDINKYTVNGRAFLTHLISTKPYAEVSVEEGEETTGDGSGSNNGSGELQKEYLLQEDCNDFNSDVWEVWGGSLPEIVDGKWIFSGWFDLVSTPTFNAPFVFECKLLSDNTSFVDIGILHFIPESGGEGEGEGEAIDYAALYEARESVIQGIVFANDEIEDNVIADLVTDWLTFQIVVDENGSVVFNIPELGASWNPTTQISTQDIQVRVSGNNTTTQIDYIYVFRIVEDVSGEEQETESEETTNYKVTVYHPAIVCIKVGNEIIADDLTNIAENRITDSYAFQVDNQLRLNQIQIKTLGNIWHKVVDIKYI